MFIFTLAMFGGGQLNVVTMETDCVTQRYCVQNRADSLLTCGWTMRFESRHTGQGFPQTLSPLCGNKKGSRSTQNRHQMESEGVRLTYNAGPASLLGWNASFVVPPVPGPHRPISIPLQVLCRGRRTAVKRNILVPMEPHLTSCCCCGTFTFQIFPGFFLVAVAGLQSPNCLLLL